MYKVEKTYTLEDTQQANALWLFKWSRRCTPHPPFWRMGEWRTSTSGACARVWATSRPGRMNYEFVEKGLTQVYVIG